MGLDNLAGVQQKLESDGWQITTDGFNILTQNGEVRDVRSVLQNALDTDLKDIGKPFLADMLAEKCIDRAVLQIQKVRNVSAPKANEDSQAAPRMLKLIVTDGHTYCQAIEYDSVPKLSHHKTPPGSKLLLTGAKVASGYVMINTVTCSYLGGKVPALFDKWELNRNISNCKRGTYEGDGPPPWVNFGVKIAGFEDKGNFKSLESKNKDGKPTEFDVQRQDAIAEAASGAVKKFGGGVKSSVQNEPLRYDGPPRNNRADDNRERGFNRTDENRERNFNRRNKREPREKLDDKQQKPSEKVSLFAFLEDKLPVNANNTPEVAYHDYNHVQNDNFRNPKPNNFSNKSKPYPYNQQYNQGFKEVDKGFVKSERAPRFNSYQKPSRDFKNPQPGETVANSFNAYQKPSRDFRNPQASENSFGTYQKPGRDFRNAQTPENVANFNSYPKPARDFRNPQPAENVSNSFSTYQKSGKDYKNPQSTENSFDAYQKPVRDFRNPQTVENSYDAYQKPMRDFMNPPPNQTADGVVNSFDRLNLNASFATKAFKQHLNLPNNTQRREVNDRYEENDFGGPKFQQDDFGGPKYKPKDFGGPKYSQLDGSKQQAFGAEFDNGRESSVADGDAKINWQWKIGDQCLAKYWDDNKYYNATVTALTDRTCVVQFNDYGNMEEVLYGHCIPITDPNHESHLLEPSNKPNDYSGSVEFRRGGNRNYYNKGYNNKPRQDRRN